VPAADDDIGIRRGRGLAFFTKSLWLGAGVESMALRGATSIGGVMRHLFG